MKTEQQVREKYDGMAGSYVKRYNAQTHKRNEYVCRHILRPLSYSSILEVGAGELTTLAPILECSNEPHRACALDLSQKRLLAGREFAKHMEIPITIVAGTGTTLPFPNSSFDVVFTSHCLEQMERYKKQIIAELCRVARRYVVMIEPSYELGGIRQKLHTLTRGYVRGIPKTVDSLGHSLCEHYLIPFNSNPRNKSALHMIKL